MLSPSNELKRELSRLKDYYYTSPYDESSTTGTGNLSVTPGNPRSTPKPKPYPPNFVELVRSSLDELQHAPGITLCLERLSGEEYPECPKRHVSLPTAASALDAVCDVVLLHPPALVLNTPKVPKEDDEFRVWDLVDNVLEGMAAIEPEEAGKVEVAKKDIRGKVKRAMASEEPDVVPAEVRVGGHSNILQMQRQYSIRLLELLATVLERDALCCEADLSATILYQSTHGPSAHSTSRDAALKLVSLVRAAGKVDGLDSLEAAQRVMNQFVLLTLTNSDEFEKLVETVYPVLSSMSWDEVETFYLSTSSPALRLHLADLHLLASFRHSMDIPSMFPPGPSLAKLAAAYVHGTPRANPARNPVGYAKESYQQAFLIGEYLKAAEEVEGGVDESAERNVATAVEEGIARRVPDRDKWENVEVEARGWWEKMDAVLVGLVGVFDGDDIPEEEDVVMDY
ncbi:hypothetical protein HDU93_003193 [Gonapodya sp. JEL0774]|nr:hypothetical protein HDU93_003193 [Gonapodya sp. JEL0774]